MMMRFEEAIEHILRNEGGYADEASDRGGETNYGISQKAYPDLDPKGITREMAIEIYRRDYWDRGRVEALPDALRLIYFDMCVNHGIAGAARILQQAAGVTVDGALGPVTLAAAAGVTPEQLRDARVMYYQAIVARDPEQARFLNGWTNRVYSV